MSRRSGWMVVLLAAAALAAVWRVLPTASPPIYDGICVANPYATLGGSPAAQPASKTFPASATFPAAEIFTGETPPQAQLLMQAGTFDSTTTLTMTITPVPTPATAPPNGEIEGNVYSITVVNAAGTELQPKPQLPVFIVLRGTRSVPAPAIDRFDGTAWTPLSTVNAGCGNTFEAQSTLMGEFAAVARLGGATAPPGPAGGIPTAAIVAALAVLLIAVVAVLLTLERGRGRDRGR